MSTENTNTKANVSSNANIVSGMTGAPHITAAPMTTDLVASVQPGLLVNAIDKAVVKVRPMATPLDQISRLGHVRQVGSMEVDYYSVDTRPDCTEMLGCDDLPTQGDSEHSMVHMTVDDSGCFEVSETLSIELTDGSRATGYVVEKRPGELVVLMTKGKAANVMPGSYLVRMGRAATQLDVQTAQFGVLPTKRTNLCQIFKMQIEQSTTLRRSHQAVGWDFTDQQEAAVYDMRLGMEKQFLFGNKSRIYDHIKGETVYLTEGIWHQAGKTIKLDLKALDQNAVVDMLRTAFTENSGSHRKILIAGSGLTAALNKIESTRVITAHDQVTAWGIDFSELQSKFGRLYVAFSDVFDSMGMPDCGIIIDPEYIQKHVFTPFSAEHLDLRGSGQRNTDALVLTECSCLTLRYPEAHARIIG